MASRGESGNNFSSAAQYPSVLITPPWPGRAYHLACPVSTPQPVCDRLGSGGAALSADCYEPEVETAEVLSSLLLGCQTVEEREVAATPALRAGEPSARDVAPASTECTYVDVGCNVGAFALQAAALGAQVRCFEPTSFFVDAVRHRSHSCNNIACAWPSTRCTHCHAVRSSTPRLHTMP
jgi:hypothetical protein